MQEVSDLYLLSGGEAEPPILIDAVKANVSIDAIKLIIQLGAFINAVDVRHRTALHHACDIGSFDTIKLLLRKGAHYFLRDDSGRTPFHIVAALSSTKCLLLVLQNSQGSEEINDGDNEGLTPLHWAVAKNHTEHLDIMLSKKYRLDLKRTDIEL
jgi:ankyrin repeat protein